MAIWSGIPNGRSAELGRSVLQALEVSCFKDLNTGEEHHATVCNKSQGSNAGLSSEDHG